MIAALHEAVAARAQAGGLPVGAAAVAEIERMLAEERGRRISEAMARACAAFRESVSRITCAAAPLGRVREGGAASEPAAPPSTGRAA